MTRLDAGTIAEASKLQLIVQFGVGLEGVDVAAATERGIRVGRIPSADTGNAVSCAEHAIYLALALLRKQKGMQESVQQQRLGQPIGQTIFGKSALIVGYGGIGKALAARLRAFGVTWMGGVRKGWAGAHGRKGEGKDEPDGLLDEWGGPESLQGMLPVADLVFLCCQQTTETIGMVDAGFLTAMKKSAILINVARGVSSTTPPSTKRSSRFRWRALGLTWRGKSPLTHWSPF
ncbi:hypothetical protein CLOM_g8057 [Closterium sp. NIES-68]|nr:hypothetical protein CLOM_g8057 [Closterium sp. NIES-68]